MKTSTLRLVILVASLMVCTGCGSSSTWYEIDVVLEQEPGGMPVTDFKVGIGEGIVRENIRNMHLHSAASNGLIHLNYKTVIGGYVGQAHPSYPSFALYIPGVSTNGCFHFRFEETGNPSRGLKQERVYIRPRYIEFDTWNEGWRTLSAIRAEVRPSENGGNHTTVYLPIRALRDGVAAEFVPYQPGAAKTN